MKVTKEMLEARQQIRIALGASYPNPHKRITK